MKKGIIFLSILILSVSLFALDSSISFGIQHKVTNFSLQAPMYTTVNLWENIGNFKIYGEYTNEMQKSMTFWGFSPMQDYFTVGISYDFDIFLVTLEHQCSHPISILEKYDSNIYSSYTKFQVTIGDIRK